ncbi:hypothetical protein MJO28_008968 [Puccinia striiformis f. sp. tritici]|uniref:Uncharacterized protein n=3 Tax=Puccinia striiformis TaxID=27350 RepID=A0A2S4VA48_9BASI|nr:hypothetical protein MJO28_008968 [Puccinia striiformis f. sp. tritici]KAI7953196.1 hypothetical protein MJO29_008827 [Puccinia striiformis f. sp. tritici]POV98999.1 hypothetical protein PSTT_14058 [Puccinia striiformis]POW06413.1 hypothetical protein PSHT_10386 [Puccinia striiformis]
MLKLDYFSTKCTYSPEAYIGHARALVKDLERIRPTLILDIVDSGESVADLVKINVKRPTQLRGLEKKSDLDFYFLHRIVFEMWVTSKSIIMSSLCSNPRFKCYKYQVNRIF